MQVKLAFAVATSIEAEILIVDEVLAVGDLAFQRKCFDRMETLIREQHRTVLIVSHNIRQIERLSERTLLIDHGRLIADGSPARICDQFYALSNANIAAVHGLATGLKRVESVLGFKLLSIDLVDKNGSPINEVVSGHDFGINLRIGCDREFSGVIPGFGIHTTDFFYLSTHSSESNSLVFDLTAGEWVVHCSVNRLPLLPGLYQLRVGIADRTGSTLVYGENLCELRVTSPDDRPMPATARDGVFLLDASWGVRMNQPFGDHKRSVESAVQHAGFSEE
jgi:hypothetical protein